MTSSFLQTLLKNLEATPKAYSSEVKEYALALEAQGLPIIFSTEHLALLMGLSPETLRNIISKSSPYYTSYRIRKKVGGHRWILAPIEPLKQIQKWITRNILNKISINECANGFVLGKSVYTNAQGHANKEVILNIDLYKFFDSISVKRVYGILSKIGYIKNLAFDISKLLCTKPPLKYWDEILNDGIIKLFKHDSDTLILPQGAPSSPTISNILCYRLDKRLFILSQKLGCTYSRYADDLSFSGNKKDIPSINTIRKIIVSEGFFINEKKTKYISKNKRQKVTGLVVNNGLRVLKEKKKVVQTHLRFCNKYGVQDHLRYLEGKGQTIKSNFKQWLLGNISFIHSIEKDTGKKMFKQFESIGWEL